MKNEWATKGWTKARSEAHVDANGEPTGEKTITYSNPIYPTVMIQSRKRNIPHSNRSGYWSHTTYVVVQGDGSEKTFYRMADAVMWAEKVGEP